jgi:hypothetical protein
MNIFTAVSWSQVSVTQVRFYLTNYLSVKFIINANFQRVKLMLIDYEFLL